MKGKYAKKPKKFVEIAKERISILFEQAEKTKSKTLANRYVEMAKKISMKYKIRIPLELRRRFCKHCKAYLVPGKNLTVRTQNGKVVYTCLDCGKHMRFVMKGK